MNDPDADMIGQEVVLYRDNGQVTCKGEYTGAKESRVYIKDEKGNMHSFPANKYDMRPATK